MWDTGATACVISSSVVAKCALAPIGVQRVVGVHGERTVNAYLIALNFPNGVAFPNLRVTEGVIGNADALIGMDVIAQGDFAITNRQGRTIFSFRIPSIARFDFVKEHESSARRLGRKHTRRRR